MTNGPRATHLHAGGSSSFVARIRIGLLSARVRSRADPSFSLSPPGDGWREQVGAYGRTSWAHGRVPLHWQVEALANSPHPNPLPEGEGVRARVAVNQIRWLGR